MNESVLQQWVIRKLIPAGCIDENNIEIAMLSIIKVSKRHSELVTMIYHRYLVRLHK